MDATGVDRFVKLSRKISMRLRSRISARAVLPRLRCAIPGTFALARISDFDRRPKFFLIRCQL